MRRREIIGIVKSFQINRRFYFRFLTFLCFTYLNPKDASYGSFTYLFTLKFYNPVAYKINICHFTIIYCLIILQNFLSENVAAFDKNNQFSFESFQISLNQRKCLERL